MFYVWQNYLNQFDRVHQSLNGIILVLLIIINVVVVKYLLPAKPSEVLNHGACAAKRLGTSAAKNLQARLNRSDLRCDERSQGTDILSAYL